MPGGMEEEARTDAPAQEASAASPNLGVKLLWVAWLAIGLGFAMEGLLLLLGAGLGKSLEVGSIVADLIKNLSWSVFVCVGLAVGTAVAKARVPVMGLLGLLAAPSAFEVSPCYIRERLRRWQPPEAVARAFPRSWLAS